MPRFYGILDLMFSLRFLTFVVSSGFFLAACLSAFAAELPQSLPEDVGVSSERLARVSQVGQDMVDASEVAGIIIQVARNGQIIHTDVMGTRGADDPRPLAEDHLFRIYSMTKPITAVAAMMLYEEGKFHLYDQVSKFIPELKDLKVLKDGRYVPAEQHMTMHHLLTHTAGFSYGFSEDNPIDLAYREAALFESRNLDEFAERLAELPLKFEPGERWHYSVAVDITGLVVQRLSGMGFDEFLRSRIFEPLDMPDTFFNVPEGKRDRFLPNHTWDAEANAMKTLEEPAPVPGYFETELFSGGGGLVSTTRDYMRFSEMLRNGGELNGVRLLSPKTVDFLRRDHLSATSRLLREGGPDALQLRSAARGMGFGLGFGIVTDSASAGVLSSEGEYYWGGAAGTAFWIDPVEELVVIAMIQLMSSPWPLRQDLRVAVYQALEESYAR